MGNVFMNEGVVTIDNIEYRVSEMSDKAKAIVESIQFTENELLRLRNLLAVLETAKMGYQRDLRGELPEDHPKSRPN